MSQVCESGVVKGLNRYKTATISVIEGRFLYARNTVGNTKKNDGRCLEKKRPSKQADGLRRNVVKIDALIYGFIAVSDGLNHSPGVLLFIFDICIG